VLIPAAMRLLGERNWHLPSWLQWLPNVQIEATSPGAPQAATPDTEKPKAHA
jgi:putative drug exporter of the RND superfamily